jgi:two-component system cell cycle sensor histidine kinase/response regulator CckA
MSDARPPTVLVVEDNPLTRKMLRLTLESEGYKVLEAGDRAGALARAQELRPDLVVLDYVLPDTDGLTLLAEVRQLAQAPGLPALVLTGMVSRLDELAVEAGRFTQVLSKPIEPSRLVEFAQVHLAARPDGGRERTVLVVDDEPLNLRLAGLRLEHAGYEVVKAGSGAEGLEKAREHPPDAILSDVLMPAMDGFAFCREVRRDPRLAQVPLVLVSSAYVEDADRDLAQKVGACALVLRTPDLGDATRALEQCLRAPTSPPTVGSGEALDTLHRERIQAQLERQTARNELLVRQAAIQATALSVIRGLSATLAQPDQASRVIGDVLVHCLDATGLSTGVLYLRGPDGRYRVEAQFGVPAERRSEAEECFGHAALIGRIVESGQPAAFSFGSPDAAAEGRFFLSRLGQASVLLVPFVVLGESFGILLLASDTHDLAEQAWIGFARSLAAQFGQTVALGQSLTRLAASEGRLGALMEEANDAILILDLPHRVLQANREAERLLGRPRSDILGRHYDEFVPPGERKDSARWKEAFLAEGRVHVRGRHLVRADGVQVPVEVSAALVRVGAADRDPVVLAIVRNVSEREDAERRLRDSEEQYRLLFDSNPHPMWVYDIGTLAFLAVNEAAVRHYGYSRGELLGMTIKDIRPPEDLPELMRNVQDYRPDSGGVRHAGSFRHRKKDGTLIDVEIASSAIQFHARPARLVLALDVTEKRGLEAQLLQAQRMDSIGRLAGGVAHDFNNILSVITGYGELLRRRLRGESTLHKYADDVVLAAHRGADLTRQLLAFSRKQVLQPRVLDLNGVVLDMERMLRRLIGEDIRLVTALEEHLPPIRADAGQLEQVLMNLVVNARDAMSGGGRLVIETGVAEFDEEYRGKHAGVPAGRHVMLAVSDTGQGMSREVQEHIFEPFFTTKEAGKGTGLGLATVHGIVTQSGGSIFVYSEPGRGTTFKVYLPAVDEAAPVAPPRAEAEPARGTETVLIVEDEAALGEILQECLTTNGYQVLQAHHGLAAMEVAERHAGPIHLLLTDVVMPGMGGPEVARQLVARRPEMKVLYMSGYTDDAVVVHGVRTVDMPFLEKPFTAEGLARKVREVLDRK